MFALAEKKRGEPTGEEEVGVTRQPGVERRN